MRSSTPARRDGGGKGERRASAAESHGSAAFLRVTHATRCLCARAKRGSRASRKRAVCVRRSFVTRRSANSAASARVKVVRGTVVRHAIRTRRNRSPHAVVLFFPYCAYFRLGTRQMRRPPIQTAIPLCPPPAAFSRVHAGEGSAAPPAMLQCCSEECGARWVEGVARTEEL